MYDECMHTHNKGNGCIIIIEEIKNLTEEKRLKLIRRGRDVFNKNKEIQVQMVALMINGGLIHKDDLC